MFFSVLRSCASWTLRRSALRPPSLASLHIHVSFQGKNPSSILLSFLISSLCLSFYPPQGEWITLLCNECAYKRRKNGKEYDPAPFVLYFKPVSVSLLLPIAYIMERSAAKWFLPHPFYTFRSPVTRVDSSCTYLMEFCDRIHAHSDLCLSIVSKVIMEAPLDTWSWLDSRQYRIWRGGCLPKWYRWNIGGNHYYIVCKARQNHHGFEPGQKAWFSW